MNELLDRLQKIFLMWMLYIDMVAFTCRFFLFLLSYFLTKRRPASCANCNWENENKVINYLIYIQFSVHFLRFYLRFSIENVRRVLFTARPFYSYPYYSISFPCNSLLNQFKINLYYFRSLYRNIYISNRE